MRPRRRRGFALADFVAGTVIFAGALGAFAALTRAKMTVLSQTHRRAQALAAAELAVDRLRREGLPAPPRGAADPDGYRSVARFTPTEAPWLRGHLDARALRMAVGDGHLLYEARVTVRWRERDGERTLRLATVVPLPKEGK
ncbi:MAG: hypothetical protein D6731_08230 [Planctomycetota bacterium]|nr:MAG: hypothetical protein D6731_08230 [Planctomycetota bacterium]